MNEFKCEIIESFYLSSKKGSCSYSVIVSFGSNELLLRILNNFAFDTVAKMNVFE